MIFLLACLLKTILSRWRNVKNTKRIKTQLSWIVMLCAMRILPVSGFKIVFGKMIQQCGLERFYGLLLAFWRGFNLRSAGVKTGVFFTAC